jgi:hypothetical protein
MRLVRSNQFGADRISAARPSLHKN